MCSELIEGVSFPENRGFLWSCKQDGVFSGKKEKMCLAMSQTSLITIGGYPCLNSYTGSHPERMEEWFVFVCVSVCAHEWCSSHLAYQDKSCWAGGPSEIHKVCTHHPALSASSPAHCVRLLFRMCYVPECMFGDWADWPITTKI
ncbi:hypothetical protein ABVT39_004618, partial [Epinephelus coioides]